MIWSCDSVFFAHLLISEDLDNHQNLISSLWYYLAPLDKISSESIHNYLSNIVYKQTDKVLTNQLMPHNLLLPRRSKKHPCRFVSNVKPMKTDEKRIKMQLFEQCT